VPQLWRHGRRRQLAAPQKAPDMGFGRLTLISLSCNDRRYLRKDRYLPIGAWIMFPWQSKAVPR
jgi:hypothetical protein